jgi:3',5'-cyclic AMP phosphodiesterase CpdA
MMDLGRYLFSIAVIADTHMNDVEYGSSSPYECNRIANARTRYVIERLNQIDPAFTIHLGDLVHPVPSMPTYAQAADNFKHLTAALRSPLHLVPGNHDVGDKPVAWAPAGIVNDAALALWRQHFGDHYYAVDFRGLHIVVVDAQIINSGLRAEAEQRAWLERDLAAHAGQRTFLCLHYPPYVSDPDESESYDNLAEPGRGWLLGLIEAHRPEAVFCGHVHNFWYNRHGESDCYILPSTAFVRQDYSELVRVPPVDGHGRDEGPKLGFFVVRIYERGHVCHVERTYGIGLDPGQTLPPASPRVAAQHTRENRRAPFGVDMRHPWTEVVEIPPTGALDEFERKRARNDYPLMALWEMGLRKLRVPFQDLEDPRTRARMRDLRRLGHTFTVYTLEVPNGRARDLLIEHHELIDSWEVVCSWPEVARTVEAIASVKDKAPLVALLSKLRTKEDVRREGSRYYHFINHGFLPEEREELEEFRARGPETGVVDGFVFRAVRQASPWTAVAAVSAATLGGRASVHVRMASTNPAEAFTDDAANANRVAEALAAALSAAGPGRPEIDVFLDTFADIDRGYFVRHGLVDRRFNPRLASHVVRHLHGALNEGGLDGTPDPFIAGARVDIPDGHVCLMRRGDEELALVLPERKLLVERVPRADTLHASKGHARWIDLATGGIFPLPWRAEGEAIEIPGRACAAPVLIMFTP